MFRAIGLIFGILILKIVYGKKYNNENNKIWKPLLVSVAFYIWLLCLFFLLLDMAAQDYLLCLVVSISFPIIILIWAIIARSGSHETQDECKPETIKSNESSSILTHNNDVAEKIIDETEKLERERQREERLVQMADFRSKGLCQHCGGEFKGFITKKCSRCGIEKNY